jgi:hypothetical protein
VSGRGGAQSGRGGAGRTEKAAARVSAHQACDHGGRSTTAEETALAVGSFAEESRLDLEEEGHSGEWRREELRRATAEGALDGDGGEALFGGGDKGRQQKWGSRAAQAREPGFVDRRERRRASRVGSTWTRVVWTRRRIA